MSLFQTLQVLIEVGGENVSFSNSALSPLYIPSWPPGEHLLSGVASRAGKCKIRPADERLTIISIHNGSKICQIFPDLNIPEVLHSEATFYILKEVKIRDYYESQNDLNLIVAIVAF